MLTNGFFARMIILESGKRGRGQEPAVIELPARILSTAKWWLDFHPGTGNLEDLNPEPAIVPYSDQALDAIREVRLEAEHEYDLAEAESDMVGTTVWGRVSEHVHKLALIYACSENHEHPRISLAGVQWASMFVMHQTRRMLYMALNHVAANPFDAECQRLMEHLRRARGKQLPHSSLLKNMHCGSKLFSELVDTLVQRGDILAIEVPHPGVQGRTSRAYLLVE